MVIYDESVGETGSAGKTSDESAYTLSSVPGYFPQKDRERVVEMVNANLDVLGRAVKKGTMDPEMALLYPSPEPDLIVQKYFALSDEQPLVLDGVGPCLGVILMEEKSGRSMVAHVEGIGNNNPYIQQYVRTVGWKLMYLFGEIPPTRIELTSMMGGEFYYQDGLKGFLQKMYKSVRIGDYHTEPKVVVDPKRRSIDFISWADLPA
jgi:hypothetical protein